jgi:hypothetical protein
MVFSYEVISNSTGDLYVFYYFPIVNELPLHVKLCIMGGYKRV